MSQPRPTVLVVDDDETILKVITKTLEDSYEVLQARNGAQAVDMYRLGEDVIELILLDLGMPKMSGYEALAEIQLVNPDIKVAVVTGLDADHERLPGVNRVLTKPFRTEQLVALVQEMLAS